MNMKHHSERLAPSPTFYLSAVVAATAAFLCVALSDASICASTPLLCGDMSPPPAFDATFVTTAGNFTVPLPRLLSHVSRDAKILDPL